MLYSLFSVHWTTALRLRSPGKQPFIDGLHPPDQRIDGVAPPYQRSAILAHSVSRSIVPEQLRDAPRYLAGILLDRDPGLVAFDERRQPVRLAADHCLAVAPRLQIDGR